MVITRHDCKRGPRPGLASLEAVMATAITLPIVIMLFALGVRACKLLFQVIGTMVGWPCL